MSLRLWMKWENEAGLIVTVAPVPTTDKERPSTEIIQEDANGPCVWNGRKCWIFPVDGASNIHATVELKGKKEKQAMTVTAFKQFLLSNQLILVEEEIEETLETGKKRTVKEVHKPAKLKGKGK